ncbi:hypothetical protein ACODNH_22715 [Haloarcula sp. NS06]|uniref:hypothetical protein n=1 Tax=Haloarcula sp. NS06 TaxID=3409688 RepID=UPI003DA743A9
MVDNKHTKSRRELLTALGAAGIAGLAGCSSGGDGGDGEVATDTAGDGAAEGTATSSNGMDSLTAAWVYNSEVGDLGWSWAHNEGRKAVAEEFRLVRDRVHRGCRPR